MTLKIITYLEHVSLGLMSLNFRNESTDYNTNGYPLYKRPNNGRKIIYSKTRTADNRFVVPYDPYLC